PSASGANAARVTLQASSPLFFGKVLTGRDSVPIRTSAVATPASFAQFAVGPGLLHVEGGILNRALGGLLGAQLSLSAMARAAAIDLFDFLSAVATHADLQGPTYDSVLASEVAIGTAVRAMADVGRATPGGGDAARALDAVVSAVQGLGDKVALGALLDAGPY